MIDNDVHIGSNCVLIAPVTIGAGGTVGGGSAISKSTEPDALSVARGRQTAADGYALRTAFEQANDRILEQEKAVAKARNTLAAWIGAEAVRPLAAAPDITRFDRPLEHLVAGLPQHPTLRTFDLREELARSEVSLAKATRDRDWSLEVGYSQRGPAFDNMISVVVAIDLPIAKERRQERDIASRLAEVEQVRAQREDARRMHEAEVRNLQADWETAGKRIGRYDTVLLPLARERAQAALAAYQGGRGELAAVLEADRSVLETELARVQSETERAKAWAGLNYLDPLEGKS